VRRIKRKTLLAIAGIFVILIFVLPPVLMFIERGAVSKLPSKMKYMIYVPPWYKKGVEKLEGILEQQLGTKPVIVDIEASPAEAARYASMLRILNISGPVPVVVIEDQHGTPFLYIVGVPPAEELKRAVVEAALSTHKPLLLTPEGFAPITGRQAEELEKLLSEKCPAVTLSETPTGTCSRRADVKPYTEVICLDTGGIIAVNGTRLAENKTIITPLVITLAITGRDVAVLLTTEKSKPVIASLNETQAVRLRGLCETIARQG